MLRDLSHTNLRNRSLEGAELTGARLAESDLRGTGLDGADLREADLRGARTGMHPLWAAGVVVFAFVLSIACGVVAGYAGRVLGTFLTSPEPEPRALGVTTIAIVLAMLVSAAFFNLRIVLLRMLPAAVILAVVGGIVAVASGVGTGRIALAVMVVVSLGAILVVFSVAARALAGTAGNVVFMITAITGGLTGAALGGGPIAAALAVAAMIAGRRAAAGRERYPLLEKMIAKIACKGGTHFRGANLDRADLRGTHLSACDFRGASLNETRFEGASGELCLFDGAPPISRRKKAPRRKPHTAARGHA